VDECWTHCANIRSDTPHPCFSRNGLKNAKHIPNHPHYRCAQCHYRFHIHVAHLQLANNLTPNIGRRLHALIYTSYINHYPRSDRWRSRFGNFGRYCFLAPLIGNCAPIVLVEHAATRPHQSLHRRNRFRSVSPNFCNAKRSMPIAPFTQLSAISSKSTHFRDVAKSPPSAKHVPTCAIRFKPMPIAAPGKLSSPVGSIINDGLAST
jgi:hypothetical protein